MNSNSESRQRETVILTNAISESDRNIEIGDYACLKQRMNY